jgi:hypothetical protein
MGVPSGGKQIKNKAMFLVNWFQSNLMMIFMVLVLFGIPLIIAIIVFTKKPNSGSDDSGQEA